MSGYEVELVLDAHAQLGEGPIWDHRCSQLIWVDILAGEVHGFDPRTARDSVVDVGSHVGAAALRAEGGLVLAVREGFATLESGSGAVRPLSKVAANGNRLRFNDGRCDSRGRFWAGTMAYDGSRGAGSLYRLEQDHRVAPVLAGVSISNGIGWSPDDRTLYYIDTPTGWIDAFDYEAEPGELGKRRHLARVEAAGAAPDGMAVDAEGFLWVALWGGSAVHRYDPEGRLERIVRLPVSQVTSCAFGGPDLDELYITSASRGLTAEQLERQPHAGALFRHRARAQGRLEHMYGG
ncbi:MAG: SMP-30/gluconolactonase/LRE family protein [Candidatus Dormibacter sp.]|uniref:SMP-30/gluconolactonase/LRE family protein n=1 Tax=Candidatus Dormibacter sp. TaxID=2973982 RepID=UPI000DB6D5B6|nr:MAG: SMP-30/gluconolaconase/LRE domain protein [Candidatus Dormibacteraeota bacterium]